MSQLKSKLGRMSASRLKLIPMFGRISAELPNLPCPQRRNARFTGLASFQAVARRRAGVSGIGNGLSAPWNSPPPGAFEFSGLLLSGKRDDPLILDAAVVMALPGLAGHWRGP
jgi:hypothetical protein